MGVFNQNYYGYIYLIYDQKNKKIYIGQKKGKIEKSINYYGSGKKIKDIIKSRGAYFLKKSVLGVCCSKEELNKAEIECIEFFNSTNTIYGYNIVLGGGTVAGLIHNKKSFINRQKRWMDNGYPCSKKIIQYDLNGNFLKHYDSIKSASDLNKILSPDIIAVCKGRQKSAGGYLWSYKEKDPIIYNQYDNGYRVMQYDKEENFVCEYKSIVEASKAVGRHMSCIRDACIGKQHTSAGYIWKYK